MGFMPFFQSSHLSQKNQSVGRDRFSLNHHCHCLGLTPKTTITIEASCCYTDIFPTGGFLLYELKATDTI